MVYSLIRDLLESWQKVRNITVLDQFRHIWIVELVGIAPLSIIIYHVIDLFCVDITHYVHEIASRFQ